MTVGNVAAQIANLLKKANRWDSKQTFSAYTVLGSGNPAIKVKKVTGTTDAVAGNTASVAHGVTLGKIISAVALVSDGTDLWTQGALAVTEQFDLSIDATNVNITSNAAAVTILNQAFTVTLIYEE